MYYRSKARSDHDLVIRDLDQIEVTVGKDNKPPAPSPWEYLGGLNSPPGLRRWTTSEVLMQVRSMFFSAANRVEKAATLIKILLAWYFERSVMADRVRR